MLKPGVPGLIDYHGCRVNPRKLLQLSASHRHLANHIFLTARSLKHSIPAKSPSYSGRNKPWRAGADTAWTIDHADDSKRDAYGLHTTIQKAASDTRFLPSFSSFNYFRPFGTWLVVSRKSNIWTGDGPSRW